jgi:hypothetical protein
LAAIAAPGLGDALLPLCNEVAAAPARSGNVRLFLERVFVTVALKSTTFPAAE